MTNNSNQNLARLRFNRPNPHSLSDFLRRYRFILNDAAEALRAPIPLLPRDCATHEERLLQMKSALDTISAALAPEDFNNWITETEDLLLAFRAYTQQLAGNPNTHLYPLNFYLNSECSITVRPISAQELLHAAPEQHISSDDANEIASEIFKSLGRPAKATSVSPRKVHEGRLQGYTYQSIASMSGCSRTTLWRRLKAKRLRQGQISPTPQTGIANNNPIVPISQISDAPDVLDIPQLADTELDAIIQDLRINTPNTGLRLLAGSLRAKGYLITERRLRASLLRINPARPLDIPLRQLPTRVPYQVPGPNALWHFDGNHKLIRWGIVIHGSTDG